MSDPTNTGHVVQNSKAAWWHRVTAWPASLKVLCVVSLGWLFVGGYLRLDALWCTAPALMVGAADLFAMTWRVYRDPESDLVLKVFGATIGVSGAIVGRAYTASRIAEVIGADANVAPYSQQLLAVVYGPLCISGLLSFSLFLAAILGLCAHLVWRVVTAVGETAASVSGFAVLFLYGWWLVALEIARHCQWLAARVFGRGELPAAAFMTDPEVQRRQVAEFATRSQGWAFSRASRLLSLTRTGVSGLSTLHGLRVTLLLTAAAIPLSAISAESKSPAMQNVIAVLATKLDFRLQSAHSEKNECLNLQVTDRLLFVASIPNVDDAVLSAHCVERFGDMSRTTGPWCTFKRERCCRFEPCVSASSAVTAPESSPH